MTRQRGRPPHDDQLTPAQWATLEWVRHGLTNKQIAARIVSAAHLIHRHEDGTEEWMAFFNDLEGRPLALMARVRST